jgi:NitT/TauT family transport system permease protein
MATWTPDRTSTAPRGHPPGLAQTQGHGVRRVVGLASPVALPLMGLVVAIGLWWSATTFMDISAILLPAPMDVLSELIRLRVHLLDQGRVTLIQTLVGFGITVVGGFLIGAAIASSRIMDQTMTPWLVAFNAVPKVAFAPLLVVWLGINMQPRVAMVVLVCFFPIVLATATGLKSTPAELIELTRSLDASRRHTFVKVRLPYALPHIFIGLKVAMPLAVIGAVIGEFAGGRFGLGYVIQQAGGSGNTALAFAAIAVLSIGSIALYYALVAIERLTIPWVRATTS